MKILVRLPNWLGDLVMSAAFIQQLQKLYPAAEISVIIKKELENLLAFFPAFKNKFTFSKQASPGLGGAWRFGKTINEQEKFDMYFSLPDSFSSALMGYATGSKKRIGYKKELRSFLLTNAYTKNKNRHRADQYMELLHLFSGMKTEPASINFETLSQQKTNIIININSEASSRRLPMEKAIRIIEAVRKNTGEKIHLIGSKMDMKFVNDVYGALPDKTNIINIAGTTSLIELAIVMASAKVMLTTDSGPAHLANALGIYTIVLFGAGNENITAPFNQNKTIIRLGELSCEPCEDNTCRRYGIPKCLTLLDEERITTEVLKHTANEL